MLVLFANKHGKNRRRIIFTLADFIVLRRPIMCFFPAAWIWMGTFGVPQIPVQCNIGIRKFRWMTFYFLIRCEGRSIQISEIAFVMYNYEWNSHLMGHHFWTSLQLSALLLCFFYPFHFLLVPVILHAFPTLSLHFLPSSQVSRFSTSRFPHAEVHRLMSKGQEAVLTQKAAWKIITWNCRHDFRDVGIFLPQVTSNIVALAFSVQHFLAVGTLEKKVLGKEKHAKNTGLDSWNIGSFLDHQSSNWFKKALNNVKSMPITGAKCETDLQITIASIFSETWPYMMTETIIHAQTIKIWYLELHN